MQFVKFSDADLLDFSIASGDSNPLHMDAEYASKTSFGQPVVFGVLGVLACLGAVPADGKQIDNLRADFHRPLFTGVSYSLERLESSPGLALRLKDGSAAVLSVAISLTPASESHESITNQRLEAHPIFARKISRNPTWEDLFEGEESVAAYRAASTEILKRRWNLVAISDLHLQALLWSSYLIGMEVPGESALFFSLSLGFRRQSIAGTCLNYAATIKSKNEARQELRLVATLADKEGVVADSQLTAFYRPKLAFDPGLSEIDNQRRLNGKTAVLIGGSRGFGASLALRLAREGALVICCARSVPEWLPRVEEETRSRLYFERLDAGDPEALTKLMEAVTPRFGCPNFLFCVAYPPIPSLRLETNSFARLGSYLNRANDLILAPLCAFLPLLAKAGGQLILISTSAVDNPVREWPHYIAAKASAEALVRVAVMQYPEIGGLIFRPDRMLTEMTNTPMGRINASSPFKTAGVLVDKLVGSFAPGSVEVLLNTGVSA